MRGKWTTWLCVLVCAVLVGTIAMNVPAAHGWLPPDPPQGSDPPLPPPPPPDPLPGPNPVPPPDPPLDPPPPPQHCQDTPEPSTIVLGLIAAGAVGLAALRRRTGK